uniref:Uncharacterized protein n=1 Tax=Rhizophora mucronata TaxID=61149 RepID=A0A2P2PA93_RHIMU
MGNRDFSFVVSNHVYSNQSCTLCRIVLFFFSPTLFYNRKA